MTLPAARAWDAADAEVRARQRVRRRTYWLCALLIALGSLPHPLMLGGFRADFLAVQLAWAGTFFVLGAAVGAGWLRPPFSGIAAGTVSLTALTVCIQLTGGLASPLFPSFYTVPLFVAVFVPGQRLPVWSAIGGTLAAVVLMTWLARVPWTVFVSQCISSSSCSRCPRTARRPSASCAPRSAPRTWSAWRPCGGWRRASRAARAWSASARRWSGWWWWGSWPRAWPTR
ncbi:hypothetical protein [Corallococcus sp. 4LFB]|uniref:hypothetical protein n=1 Tax=Corallococcus sp. 4LFB TaxID=3383249 RepID=UPI00397531F2